MSRYSLFRPRRTRSVWDRPASDTRLLPTPLSNTVSLGPSAFPYGKTTKPSAPSRLPPSRVTSESHLPLPLHRTVDARGLPRMTSRCLALYRAFLLAADACPHSPQMFPRLTLASVSLRRGCLPRLAADVSPQLTLLRAFPSAVDARVFARMNYRSAVPGAEADACAFAQAISHAPAPDAPANAAEGALALPSLYTVIPAEAGIHPSETTTHNPATHPAPFHCSRPRSGIHPQSRKDLPHHP